MKFRTDFVTNSSSSSFIITNTSNQPINGRGFAIEMKNNNQIRSLISNIDFKLNNGFLFHSISIDKWNDIYKKEILNIIDSKYELDIKMEQRILNILQSLNNDLYNREKFQNELNTEISIKALETLSKMDGVKFDISKNSEKFEKDLTNIQNVNNCQITFDYEEISGKHSLDIDIFALCLDEKNNFKDLIYYNKNKTNGVIYEYTENGVITLNFSEIDNSISKIKIFASVYNSSETNIIKTFETLKNIKFEVLNTTNATKICNYVLDSLFEKSVICMEFVKNNDDWILNLLHEEFSENISDFVQSYM